MFALLLPLYALTTPISVGGSIQPQIDGGFGVLVLGLVGWLLVADLKPRWQLAAFVLAGLLVGLGRAEWSLAFAAAAIVFGCASAFWGARRLPVVIALLVGIAVGTVIGYAASPADYAATFNVMYRVADVVDPFELAKRQLIFTAPVAVLLLLWAAAFLGKPRQIIAERPGSVIAALASGGILVGFGLCGWPGDGFPRYFATALVLAVYGLFGLLSFDKVAWSRPAYGLVICMLCAGLAFNGYYLAEARIADVSITENPGRSLPAVRHAYETAAASYAIDKRLRLVSAGFWLYYPNVPFISFDLGQQGADEFLQENFPALVGRLALPKR